MTRAIFITPESIDFTAGAHVHVFLPITRENVYYIRRLIHRYARKGYHVNAVINHNGRLVSNVFGSDIYTQARRREERKSASIIILEQMRACDNEIDQSITYCDRRQFRRADAEHHALWNALVKIDHDAAMAYKKEAGVKDRARRIHAWI